MLFLKITQRPNAMNCLKRLEPGKNGCRDLEFSDPRSLKEGYESWFRGGVILRQSQMFGDRGYSFATLACRESCEIVYSSAKRNRVQEKPIQVFPREVNIVSSLAIALHRAQIFRNTCSEDF